MDDPLSRGLPFELADLWRRSAFQIQDGNQTLFAPLEASFPSLELDSKPKEFEQELSIPPLDGIESDQQHLDPVDSDIASPPSELWDTGQDAQDDPASVWDVGLDLDLLPGRPRLHTWEAFEKKTVPNAERTAYLSEAGPGAFDAVLAKRAGKSNGVLPKDVMLRALCNLVLGRASIFFQWDEQKAAFTRTLEDVPISGYSTIACDSFIQHLMEYATLYRSLRSSSTYLRSKRQGLPCLVAFNGCLVDILDYIEQRITNQMPQVRSIIQLQALVILPRELLVTLDMISRSVKAAETDEGVISALSDHVHEILGADSYLGGVLRLVLERTSAPWLEKLATDFGLIDDPTDVAEAQLDEDATAVDFDSSAMTTPAERGEMPGFMSSDDRRMVHDAKASLRILRKTLSQRCVDRAAQKLSQSALGKAVECHSVVATKVAMAPGSERGVEDACSVPEMEDLVWADATIQHDFLARIDARMSGSPEQLAGQDDDLRNAVLSYCTTAGPSTELAASLIQDIGPLDRLRPALALQSRYLNRTLLQHLFANGLSHHIRLQHSYHFLSSGEFVTRLSTALFSIETQSAERKRGTIPTGQAMGLRLGARNEQRWPPASSELRLTVMDVLIETYRADYPSASAKMNAKELPGGLSFSIRELPEHEIDRVMDPSSIYALDFLRLQYSAPAPLNAILTSASMQVYDSVFRQLLRVQRVLHVTTALTREMANRTHTHGAALHQTRFARQAHAFTTTLLSHMMDLGICSPWRTFMRTLGIVERSLQDEVNAMPTSLEDLEQMHTAYLDRIRSRLFLRRKQEKVRLAIEDVLSALLKGAAIVEHEGHQMQLETVTAEFEGAMKALLELLRSAVDKPPKMRATTGTSVTMNAMNDEDDIEVMRMLLVRLNWNGFYREGGTSPV